MGLFLCFVCIFRNMGHPQPIKNVIVKKCPKLLRIYGNVVFVTYDDVDDPEVLLESVSDKDYADVHQVAQLEVGGLEGRQVLGRDVRVQVARLDTRELGQIINHLKTNNNNINNNNNISNWVR